jgi:hypothetical protein
MRVAVLEDDEGRSAAMRAAFASGPDISLELFPSAGVMIAWLE